MADMTQTVDLDSTIAALQSGITSLPPEAAISTIESWQSQLQGTEIAGSSSIGEVLSDLGAQTSSAAGTATGDAMSKLQQLGQLLSQAGSSLT